MTRIHEDSSPQLDDEPITKAQLNVIEKSLDTLFGKLGMDIVFTKHFFERLNDARNKKQITPKELSNIYHDLYDKYGITLSHTDEDIEELITSISTKINIPLQVQWNRKTKKLELVAKTVMRVGKFFSKAPITLTVEKTFKEFLGKLDESISPSMPLIVIDIQPEYERECKKILTSSLFKDLLNNQKDILWYFNGNEMIPDTEDDIKQMILNYGFQQEVIDKIVFKEKGYFFLRRWMDKSIPYNIILKVIRSMVQNKVAWSDEINLENELEPKELNTLKSVFGIKIPNISLPDYISIKDLKNYSGGYIIGGQRMKCLKEITLIMNAFNLKYKEISSLIF